MIKIEHLSFKYDRPVFDDIDLTIDGSKTTFIIGPNGSGKSTLARLISGLLFPSSGKITLDDLALRKRTDNKLIRKKVGIIFQNPDNQIIFPRVYDDIKFTLENMRVPTDAIDRTIRQSLELVGMSDFINANPYDLSGGQKQCVAIASQLSLKPDYLIFDEATSMLDPGGKRDIYHLIRQLKQDTGIIFITNNLNELIHAEDVIIIDNREVYTHPISDLIGHNDILSKHKLDIPLIFKIAHALGITDPTYLSEDHLIERLSRS